MARLAGTFVVAVLLGTPSAKGTERTALAIHRAEYEMHRGHTAIKDPFGTTYFMSATPELTDRDLKTVRLAPDERGVPRIKISFTKAGGRKFRALTRTHMRRPLVFLLARDIVMVPFVNEVATEDSTWVEGRVTDDQAQALSAAVRAQKK